ncbi:DUF554 domain-containing protein [Desulfovibrio sp. OttesenSCG-928-M14]|nr:DUF554 domain-containing protein [Desulfovibrio sp. OttesenSCG-928-M14]
MIGVLVDSGSLALGGLTGVLVGRWIPERVKTTLPLIFGVVTIAIGTTLTDKAAHMHVVVLALIAGAFIGELCYMEKGLENVIRKSIAWSRSKGKHIDENFIIQYVTLLSAFCFGSMGLFGAVQEGITGDPSILFIKAVLDVFSGLIFGAAMGIQVSFIAVPQFLILAGLYWSAGAVMSLVSPTMLQDFTSCGGIVFLATGLRLCGIKIFPVINMLPALVIVLPLSYLWTAYFQ